ncbi:hypothetical protein CONCODRAFT_72678 [Conidiobolus coronatus NRRL 28638]|uniref:Uncharacterized protein n=1 Tax=Conidiobolus coronatus (strain ATCC 28846 / CBS 209.66 / NRRL 28638) TaxID=796925 RepID=A0A137NYH4_CONC2|nr:hypothetical protein CONCODRAFT_72678 [Conidiobolus coronatus NRRL 28638]|eukprot:KXN67855.1 hypothetical protein CONCODRAFT_72678 [Conidiobolus coronatus NRRL 28638]
MSLAQFMINNDRLLLFHSLGSGKSITALACAKYNSHFKTVLITYSDILGRNFMEVFISSKLSQRNHLLYRNLNLLTGLLFDSLSVSPCLVPLSQSSTKSSANTSNTFCSEYSNISRVIVASLSRSLAIGFKESREPNQKHLTKSRVTNARTALNASMDVIMMEDVTLNLSSSIATMTLYVVLVLYATKESAVLETMSIAQGALDGQSVCHRNSI